MMPSSSNQGRDILTDDVLFEIFLFLPVDSLLQFRCVCKCWFNLITSNIHNPRFVELHTHNLHHHPSHATATTTTDNLPTILCTSTSTNELIPYHHLYSLNNSNTSSLSSSSSSSCKNKKIDAIEIVYPFQSPSSQLEILGSCNGLLCIQETDYNDHMGFTNISNPRRKTVYPKGILYLWNPSTKEFKQVPAEGIIKPGHSEEVMYGFGYDRLINDNKLVIFVGLNYGLYFNISQLHVYTLGTNSWKRISKKLPFPLQLSTKGMKPVMMGSYVNGALHWISKDKKRIIYSFNIEDEEFREVPKPECFNKVKFRAGLQVLRGCLCIFSSYFDQHIEPVFEVWMMMDYGVKESWTKLLSTGMNLGWKQMGLLGNLKPLWICRNGEVLIGSGGVQWASKHLAICDPNNNKVIESIGIQGIPVNRSNEIVHIGSFVPLKSGTCVDQNH